MALLESSRAGAKTKNGQYRRRRRRRKEKEKKGWVWVCVWGGGGERKLLPVMNLNRSTETAAAVNSKAHVTTLTTSPVLLAVAALDIVVQFRWSSSIFFFQYPTER